MPKPTTVIFDAFANKNADELQADCRRLLRAASDRERVIKDMIELLGDRIEELPPFSRDHAKWLINAYKD